MHLDHIQIAPHAIDRAHSGGIPEEGISLAALYGQSLWYEGKRVSRTLTGRILQRLVRKGTLTPAAAERLEGVTVLTKDTRTTRIVVTTLPKRPLLGPQRLRLANQRYLGHRNGRRRQAEATATPSY